MHDLFYMFSNAQYRSTLYPMLVMKNLGSRSRRLSQSVNFTRICFRTVVVLVCSASQAPSVLSWSLLKTSKVVSFENLKIIIGIQLQI